MKPRIFVSVLGILCLSLVVVSCNFPNETKKTEATEATFLLKVEPTLIEDVSIAAIIADTSLYGTFVGAKEAIPPPPWQTRLKIALDSDVMESLSGDLDFGGTVIEFRDSNLDDLPGLYNQISLKG